MKTAPVFEMRGLCYGTSFDRHFGWNGVRDSETEQYSFPGFSKSMLQVDNFQRVPFVHHFRQKFNINSTCHESTCRAATAGKAPKAWALPRFWVSICSYKKQHVKKIGVEY